MAVYNKDEVFERTVLDHDGWYGARAEGDFGTVEGWVQVVDGASGPKGFGDRVEKGELKICGRDRDAEIFTA